MGGGFFEYIEDYSLAQKRSMGTAGSKYYLVNSTQKHTACG
jgi:hypothetical protein